MSYVKAVIKVVDKGAELYLFDNNAFIDKIKYSTSNKAIESLKEFEDKTTELISAIFIDKIGNVYDLQRNGEIIHCS